MPQDLSARSNWDIDLKYGQEAEKEVAALFEGTNGKVEVKAERRFWQQTGNFCIERAFKGQPSGVSVTKSDWWCQAMRDLATGEILGMLVLRPKLMRINLPEMLTKGTATLRMLGDGHLSECYIIPIANVGELFKIKEH